VEHWNPGEENGSFSEIMSPVLYNKMGKRKENRKLQNKVDDLDDLHLQRETHCFMGKKCLRRTKHYRKMKALAHLCLILED